MVGWRCRRHRSPALDLSLLNIRAFSVANAMMVIGAAGYYGYTLANVLFLTSVWRYSVLQAGLALSVGPVVAVAAAGPASRLARRVGPRPVLVAGGLLWGAALLWFVGEVGMHPDFAGRWLPGMVLLGIGAGTTFPNLAGTAIASAPGGSFATATGMNSVARQVGAALGIAVVAVMIGTPTPATAYTTFRHAWVFGAACLFCAGLGCLLIGRGSRGDAEPASHAVTAPGTGRPHRGETGAMSETAIDAGPACDGRDWRVEAACRDADPDPFFPDPVRPTGGNVKQAKMICRSCPVGAACLNWALVTGEAGGIWGGLTEAERRRLRRGVRPSRPSAGSDSGRRDDRNAGPVVGRIPGRLSPPSPVPGGPDQPARCR